MIKYFSELPAGLKNWNKEKEVTEESVAKSGWNTVLLESNHYGRTPWRANPSYPHKIEKETHENSCSAWFEVRYLWTEIEGWNYWTMVISL